MNAPEVKTFCFLFWMCCYQPAAYNQVQLINIDQLNQRVQDGKDTTFIINFWATWCLPCIKELPNFEKLNNTYQSEKLKIMLVSVDFKSKRSTVVTPFVKKGR